MTDILSELAKKQKQKLEKAQKQHRLEEEHRKSDAHYRNLLVRAATKIDAQSFIQFAEDMVERGHEQYLRQILEEDVSDDASRYFAGCLAFASGPDVNESDLEGQLSDGKSLWSEYAFVAANNILSRVRSYAEHGGKPPEPERETAPAPTPPEQSDHEQAEQSGNGSPANKGERCPRGAAPELILAALCKHHEYEVGSIGNWKPATLSELEKLAVPAKTGAISFWLKEHFGSHEGYSHACNNESLLYKLRVLRVDITSADLADAKDFMDQRDHRARDPAHD